MTVQGKIVAPTLHAAMATAFGEIEAATKDAVNPAFKQGNKVSKYADLTAVIDAIKPALIRHGLFFTQHPEPSERGVTVETWVHHSGGESLSLGKLFVPANKQDAQGYGSALTYARRYALVTAFGVPVEDDDGNAAARAVRDNAGSTVSSDGLSPSDFAKFENLRKATDTNVARLMEAIGMSPNTKPNDLAPDGFNRAIAAMETKLAKLAQAQTNKVAEVVS